MDIVDLQGRPIQQQGPANLKPSAILLHCVYEPDSGTVQLHRSERNPPPKNNHELKVELDNWFTVLVNCLCLIMAEIDNKMGVPREVLLPTVIRTINTYFESGGTGGHRKKIVVNRPADKVAEPQPPKEVIACDYDYVFVELGYKQLGKRSNETYVEYCGNVGLSDRIAERMPLNAEFFNSIVFRKEIAPRVFLEAARDKEISNDASEVSKYVISLIHDSDSLKRKTFWQIKNAKNTKELLAEIEKEALAVWNRENIYEL